MSNRGFDAVISGSGLVGAAVALGLADRGLSVAVIEATQRTQTAQPSHDQRTLVLNAASLNILQSLGLLPDALDRIDVRRIIINRQGGLGHLHLNADEHRSLIGADTHPDHPYFGQVVVAQALGQVMLDRLAKHPNITEYCPQRLVAFEALVDRVEMDLEDGAHLTARILVGADGTDSFIRNTLKPATEHHDYGQSAMVFNVGAEKPQAHTAFERFTAQGPLALLPQANGRYGVVWIDGHEAIAEGMDWSDAQLLDALAHRFGSTLGAFSAPSQRASYRLIKQHTPQPVRGRVVLVGNAANSVHPVSAQGFNLGLRDAACLIDVLDPDSASMPMGDDHWAQALANYQGLQQVDQQATVRYTDTLARTFAHPAATIRWLAGLGLMLHAASPTLKARLVRAAMGFRSPVSSLAKPGKGRDHGPA